jgi:DNA-3-methyladenine glycosylase II
MPKKKRLYIIFLLYYLLILIVYRIIKTSKEIRKAISILSGNDIRLKGVIDYYGELELKPSDDYLFSICKSIIGQQLSKYAARSICNRFINKLNYNAPVDPNHLWNLSESELLSIGLSRSKASYIKEISKAFKDGHITNDFLKSAPSEEIEKALISIKGIGKWTVDMFLIFSVNNLDVFPFTDAGIKRGVQMLYKMRILPNEAKLKRISNRWKPYRSIASLYLWKIVDEGMPTK